MNGTIPRRKRPHPARRSRRVAGYVSIGTTLVLAGCMAATTNAATKRATATATASSSATTTATRTDDDGSAGTSNTTGTSSSSQFSASAQSGSVSSNAVTSSHAS